jgi:hypothetical protein
MSNPAGMEHGEIARRTAAASVALPFFFCSGNGNLENGL